MHWRGPGCALPWRVPAPLSAATQARLFLGIRALSLLLCPYCIEFRLPPVPSEGLLVYPTSQSHICCLACLAPFPFFHLLFLLVEKMPCSTLCPCGSYGPDTPSLLHDPVLAARMTPRPNHLEFSFGLWDLQNTQMHDPR